MKNSVLALSILDAIPLATLALENRKIIFANRAVERVFGWKPEKLTGKSTKILYSTREEYEKVGEEFYRDLEKERMFIGQSKYTFKRKDGSSIICRLSAARLGNGQRSRKVVVTFEDISELKKIEQRLLESEKLYRTLSEGSLSGVYVVQKGAFKYINSQAAFTLGYKPHELIGRKVLDMVYAEDRNKVVKYARLMLKGKRSTPYLYRAMNRKGELLWIMETVKRIVHEESPAILATSMDVTELTEARIKIEEFNKVRSSILDATPHAIMYLEDRKIIFANRDVESVFGWKREELIGNSTRMLFRSDRDFKEMGRMAYSTLKKTRVFDAEYGYRHKNGEGILCRVKAVRIGESLQNRRLIVTYENITEQKRTQNTLRQRTEELEQKTKNLEEANIALNVILKKRETDRSNIEESVVHNIRELIMPCIQQMKRGRMDHEALKYAALVESYLMNIASSFLHKLSIKHLNLTQKEVLVASLLKDGKSSKEIADLLNITVRGVDFHRNRIRRKLGLSNKKENLRSYLISCFSNDTEPHEMMDRGIPASNRQDILR